MKNHVGVKKANKRSG